MIPDMREKHWRKKINTMETIKKIYTKSLVNTLKNDYGVDYKPRKEQLTLVLAQGDFYHHIKKINENHKVYYFNINLVKDVVGNEEHDIYGYLIEFLAYGFFEKSIRNAIVKSNKTTTLFIADSEKTKFQDSKTIHQYYKVFYNEY
jgi:hypothetical protein